MSITHTNPLILVCHQLHQETKNVPLEINSEVALYGMNFATPSSYTFNLFTKQIGIAAIAQLRKVAISGAPSTTAERLSCDQVSSYLEGFRKFCALHPRTKIIIRFQRIGNVNGAG